MRRNNWIKNVIGLLVIAIIGGLIIFFVDHIQSKPVEFSRDFSGNAEKAKMEREYVKVELSQLNEFLTVLKDKSSAFKNVKDAKYDAKEQKTIVAFEGTLSENAKEMLFGTQDVSKRWNYYYKRDGNAIFLDTEFVEGDTIVQVPAFTFAKIVEAYEKLKDK